MLSIRRTIALNRETVLLDYDGALTIYTEMIQLAGVNNGSADYFASLQGAARILSRKRMFDEALGVLDKVNAGKLPGSWRAAINLSRGQVLASAGKATLAKESFEKVVADKTASNADRKRATELLKTIRSPKQ